VSTEPSNENPHGFAESADELYESAPCGYLSTTPDGRIVRVNETFVRWIGCEREELLAGRRFADLLTMGGKIYYETHFALLLQMHGHVNEIALDLVCREGQVLPALVSAVQKRDAGGLPLLNRITVFNATERRRYEQDLLLARRRAEDTAAELSRVNSELTKSNSELLKVNEELGQFAYAASHDLQEPLRTITTYSQLLARRYQDVLDANAQSFINNIVEGSRRMQALIGDLLTLSQVQGSPLVLRATPVDQTLAIAIANLRFAIQESQAIITNDKLPVATLDAARISQVFQNLIGNAIKYRKPDETPRVHVSAGLEGREWVFQVEDNGLGFDPRYSEHIFAMFKRLHGRDIAGTGIGLAICKRIVEMQGGRIWATSTPGVGSRFSFTIPETTAN
jgi:PAS domain S-box-containing protein